MEEVVSWGKTILLSLQSHSTLSRIDLILCNEEALKRVEEVDYKPRGISDHSPIVCSIKIGVNYGRGDWKINPFWLEIIKDTGEIAASLREFLDLNSGTASSGTIWDTLKAYLRGVLIQKIIHVKRQSQAEEVRVREEVEWAELRYVEAPTPHSYDEWVKKHEYKNLVLEEVENKKLF